MINKPAFETCMTMWESKNEVMSFDDTLRVVDGVDLGVLDIVEVLSQPGHPLFGSMNLYVFGALSDEKYHSDSFLRELLSRGFAEAREKFQKGEVIRTGTRLFDSVGDGGFSLLHVLMYGVQMTSEMVESWARDTCFYDQELAPYVEVRLHDVSVLYTRMFRSDLITNGMSRALSKLSELWKKHRQAWPYNRLVCQILCILLNPSGVESFEEMVDLGGGRRDVNSDLAGLKALHSIKRLARTWPSDITRKTFTGKVDHKGLASKLYVHTALGRNNFGTDYKADLVDWVDEPVPRRLLTLEGALDRQSYVEMENGVLHECWKKAFSNPACTGSPSWQDFKATLQSAMGHGFGKTPLGTFEQMYSGDDVTSTDLRAWVSLYRGGYLDERPKGSRRATMEVLDLEEMLETADREADEVAKLFNLEYVTLVHLFLKREAGRDRQLQQIGDSMFLRTMFLMSPVLKTWFLDDEFIIGESGSRTFEEVAERLFNFQDKGNGGSNVCTDHSGFEKSHHRASNVSFFREGGNAEKAVFGSSMHPDREETWRQCEERVQNQIFVIQDEIDKAVDALRERDVAEDCYRMGSFRGRPALFVIVHDGLCSAAPDTMLRNCFLHKSYAKASETSAASVAQGSPCEH